MDKSLSTEIGERGVNLSGGQRQRISLARAAYFNRPIVLLDDSFSAIDPETEVQLTKELIQNFWGKNTRILVTHRYSILQVADWIYVLDDGVIKEQGKAADLLNSSLQFRRAINPELAKG
jgi:ABC-type bacteriocin/lantibiotic exporter with double-glycine peptidase domain